MQCPSAIITNSELMMEATKQWHQIFNVIGTIKDYLGLELLLELQATINSS